MKTILLRALSLCATLVLIAGCGRAPAEPSGDIIVLEHGNQTDSYTTPVVEAVAAVEGLTVETDASGVQRVALTLPDRTLTLTEYQSHEQIMQRLQATADQPVAAVLVIMGTHGMMPDQLEQLDQAHAAGVPVVTVLQSQIHLIDDLELLDLEEMEVAEALTRAGYPGNLPVDRASAVKAVAGDAAARVDISKFLTTLRRQLASVKTTA